MAKSKHAKRQARRLAKRQSATSASTIRSPQLARRPGQPMNGRSSAHADQSQVVQFDSLEQFMKHMSATGLVQPSSDWHLWQSMLTEMKAIEERHAKGWSVTAYQYGQLALFKAVAPLCPAAVDVEPDLEQFNFEAVRQAGVMLNESGGYRDMHDAVQIWLPRCLHRLADLAFDGIGEWRA